MQIELIFSASGLSINLKLGLLEFWNNLLAHKTHDTRQSYEQWM